MGATRRRLRNTRAKRRILLALLLALAFTWILDARFVVSFESFRCPDGYVPRPIGLLDGVVHCDSIAGGPGGAETLLVGGVGGDRREVGLFLANPRVRVFDFDFVAEHFLGPGLNVIAP